MNAAVLPSVRRVLKFCLPFLLAFTCYLSLTSCNPKNFRTEAAQVSQWVTTTLGDPKTFNYSFNQEFPHIFLFTATEGLTALNSITRKYEPGLAESWEFSDDKKRIVFTLRQGLKWSDGEPLTADDVVFTYQDIIFNPKIPTDWKDSLKIGTSGAFPKINKIDNRRVEFILPEPFAPFLSSTIGAGTSSGVGILPKHALYESVQATDAQGNPQFLSTWGTNTDPSKIIVNGPYKIESYAPSQRVVFRRNPYYWRKDSQGNQLPYIERIVWQIIESTDTSILQFRSGSLDTVEISPENFSLLKREEKRGRFTIYNGGPRFQKTFISFNLNKGSRRGKPVVDPIKSQWFNNVKFRQAVAYGIDRQTMLNNIFRGIGVVQNSPIDIQSPYYLPPEKGLKVYDYNPEKARKLLLEAGFKYNAKNQLLDADGNPVRFTLMTNAENRTRVAMGAQIKRDLSKIGITVDFNPIAFNTLTDKLSNSLDWECYLLGFTGGIEPHDGANVWLPEGGLHTFNQKPQPGQEPLEGWEVAPWEAEIGRLYIKGAQELDEAKRYEIYAETQRLTQEYLPAIHLVNPLSLVAVRDRLQNVKFSALGSQGGTLWNKYELKVAE
jgi:peptide/nickel transport system substrate-binding protein